MLSSYMATNGMSKRQIIEEMICDEKKVEPMDKTIEATLRTKLRSCKKGDLLTLWARGVRAKHVQGVSVHGN